MRQKLVGKYLEHRGLAHQFGASSLEAADIDERASKAQYDALFEEVALLSKADDLREAYRQQTGTMPLPIDSDDFEEFRG
ncbi:hypothetical protein [Haloarcula nitratireducens]|uniref:Uncharacterized protein n=1 Tax=Haloarcula nitratireducens TaxID=2487749 RepID=A0AAW4PJL3_9EURY|nr:hypothetical protein [Halomicroarcula nitratireducens]MBX0297753.1 hypothetical protein [Halomicroarcula nitratireducens]